MFPIGWTKQNKRIDMPSGNLNVELVFGLPAPKAGNCVATARYQCVPVSFFTCTEDILLLRPKIY